jgi:voltage-gated potassium channel
MSLAERRRRVYEIVEIGAAGDLLSRAYDLFYTLTIVLNLTATVLDTYNAIHAKYGALLRLIEFVTVTAFAVDYVLRIYTADFHYRGLSRGKAAVKYALSFGGVVDILSFLPVYLPFFFPSGAAAFRLVRVIRIFRLFRINAYYDSLNVITSVLSSKKNQLISSVSIILVLMLASSLCMYSLENEAQPDVFSNAFSGIWWAASTLLTVGYGDIYPVTTMGRILGIVITFLGVGMVAIPTGIISAGFVEQDTRLKRLSEQASEYDLHFIKVQLQGNDPWVGKKIRALGLPSGVIIAAIQRRKEVVIPKGDVVLQDGDVLVIGAEFFKDDWHVELKEVHLRRHSPWNGMAIRDLDISRQTLIVLIKRRGTMLIPNGDMILREGDTVLLYTKSYISGAVSVEI